MDGIGLYRTVPSRRPHSRDADWADVDGSRGRLLEYICRCLSSIDHDKLNWGVGLDVTDDRWSVGPICMYACHLDQNAALKPNDSLFRFGGWTR